MTIQSPRQSPRYHRQLDEDEAAEGWSAEDEEKFKEAGDENGADGLDDAESAAHSDSSILHSIRRLLLSCRRILISLYLGQRLALKYLWSDTKRQKKGCAIGVFTVFLVVAMITLLENNVQHSPLIFWRIAETTVGESDLVLTSGFGVGGQLTVQGESSTNGLTNVLVHQQYVADCVKGLEEVWGATGRWLLFARVLPSNVSGALVPDPMPNTTSVVTNTSFPSPLTHSAAAFVLGIDSLIEQRIKLGRSWNYPPLDARELYLSRSILRELRLDPSKAAGTPITLRMDLLDVASALDVGGSGLGVIGEDSADGIIYNNTSGRQPSAREEAEAEAMDENDGMNEQRNQARTMRVLIERAFPNATQVWDRPVQSTNRTGVLFAFLDYVNATLSTLDPDAEGYLPFPVWPFSDWKPGDPIPEPLLPLTDAIAQSFGMHLTPEQLAQLLKEFVDGIQIGPMRNATEGDIDFSIIQLDPETIQGHLARMRNGTETYGQLLDVFTPFLMTVVRMDSTFTIKAVVDDPDGKWAQALGSVVVMENGALMSVLSHSIERILTLQSRINITIPILPPIPPEPPFLTNPTSSSSPSLLASADPWPLTRLLQLLFPSLNGTQLDSALDVLDGAAQTLRNNTLSLMGIVQYADRLHVYSKTLEDMNADLIQFTNVVAADGVGVDYPLMYTLPLATAMKLTIYVRMFLDNIFGSVLALLVLLGSLLIYSLQLADVESKTYEYGMLRALGMKHRTLVQILCSKAMMFAIPGILLGWMIAFVANVPLAITIGSFARVSPIYTFVTDPLLASLVVGLVMPLIANIVPISRALSKTLRDSLDIYHVVVSEVRVKMIRLEAIGIDLWQTSISVLLIVVGFVTFYVVPYAFTFQKLPLFLAILNAILLAMLLGLCIIATLLQSSLERLVVRFMLFFVPPHSKLRVLIVKNLAAHSSRNNKTSQMFTICLAFLVFAGVMFNLQSAALVDNLKVISGADVQIFAPIRDTSQRLREDAMRQVLDGMIARRMAGDASVPVLGYSFVSYPLNAMIPVDHLRFSTLPSWAGVWNRVFGLERNYLHVTYDEYVNAAEMNTGGTSVPISPSGNVDVVGLLYTDEGGATLPEEQNGVRIPADVLSSPVASYSLNDLINETATDLTIQRAYTSYIDVLVSEALSGSASVSTSTPLHLSVHSWNDDTPLQNDFLAKARGMMVKMPGFLFSSYRQTARRGSILVSMKAMREMMKQVYGDYPVPSTPPKQKLMIKLSPSATRNQREDLINALRTFFRTDKTRAVDTRSLIGTMDQAVALLNLFFTLVGAIAMIMCFFILWLSFIANVHQNAYEFGVLRSIGLNSVEVVMLYVYEALALVLASVILGTSIGLLIAATLTLQFNLFTELPFRMQFPTPLFLTMFIMAIAVAVLGSALPAYAFLKKSISAVLRRQ